MYQKITIIGRLGRDPEMRYMPDGTPVTSFSVATSRRWTDQSGQSQERTVWFRVTAWRRLAETCNQYLSKGRLVFIEGELNEPRVYQSRDGEYRASLDVTARLVQFLGGRGDANSYSPPPSGSSMEPEETDAAGSDTGSSPAGAASDGGSVGSLGEEEIPF